MREIIRLWHFDSPSTYRNNLSIGIKHLESHKTINYDTNHRQKQYEQYILCTIVNKEATKNWGAKEQGENIGEIEGLEWQGKQKYFCVMLYTSEWVLLHREEIGLISSSSFSCWFT